jgi:hypothetical protein
MLKRIGKKKMFKKALGKIVSRAFPPEAPQIDFLKLPRIEIAATAILGQYQKLIEHVEQKLSQEEFQFFNEALLVMLSRLNLSDPEKQARLFKSAETYGVHILPVHFYSPIPSGGEIESADPDKKFDHIPNLIPNRNEFIELLNELVPFFSELSDIPKEINETDDTNFYWKNSAFGPLDACIYYSLIRYLKPNRIVEVGGGFSTVIASRALKKNKKGSLLCIEPFPSRKLVKLHQEGSIELRVEKVQNISLQEFSTLSERDILFIDSSHVSKFGSDVNYEVFQILPSLTEKVWVHFHDIFYPSDYPKRWVKNLRLFWNEQYLLLAFLAYNPKFKIRMANNYVGQELREHCYPYLPYKDPSGDMNEVGGSLWIERI